MANPKRKRKCRASGETVVVAKQAIVTDSLETSGKKNPAGLSGESGIRPKGKPEKIKIIPLKDLAAKSFSLPEETLDLSEDSAARINKGEIPDFSGTATGRFLLKSGDDAIGIAELEKGSLSSISRFSEPLPMAKGIHGFVQPKKPKREVFKREKLTLDTPIEGLPVVDLLEAHWDVHLMFTLKGMKPDAEPVKDFTIEDLVNLHARIADALLFRGTEHPQPPDNGLDRFSFEFERFALKQPRHFQRPSSGGDIPLVKAISPYQDVPPEDGTYRFVAQNHHAGHHSHLDFRIGFKPDEMLLGWELRTIPQRGMTPITTLRDAREFATQEDLNVINWETGAWSTPQVVASQRPAHPWVWLDVQGATADPTKGDDPFEFVRAPGSGWHHPGVFLIVDRGEVEFGLQTNDTHEYFVKGDLAMNYRMVMESATWRESDDVEIAVNKSNLPPEDERLGELESSNFGPWVASMKKDPRPMVLSAGAPMPPDGFSALPRMIRGQVPAKFRYWTAKGDEAKAKRDGLVKALASGEAKIDFAATFKKPIKKRSLVEARFVSQWWTDSETPGEGGAHELRVDVGRNEHLVIKCENRPWQTSTTPCEVSGESRAEMMSVEGELRQSHYLNKAKTNAFQVLKEDEGEATVMSLSEGFIRINFKGERLKGTYDVRKQGDEWTFISPTSGEAEVQKTPGDYVNIVKFADEDDEERLVTGIVLEPDEIDTQNDTMKAPGIKATAHDFLAKFNKESELGLQHQAFGAIGVKLVESFIAPVDMVIGGEKVKKGSWVITVKVISDSVWDAIKRGDFTGFSIGGLASIV